MVRLRVRTHAQTASSAPRAASLPQAAAPPPSAASEQKIRSPDVASVSEPKKSKVNLRVVTNPEAAGSGVKRTTRRTSRFNPIGNVAAARTRATRYDPVRDGVEGTRGRSASPSVPATASPAPASPLAPAPGSPPPPAPGSPPPPTVPRPSPPTVPSPRRTPTLPPVPLPPVRSPTLTGPLFLSPVALVPSLGLSLITTGLSPPPVQLPELFEATVKEETLATPPLSPLHSLQGDLEQGNYVFTNEEEEQERSPSPPPGYDPQNEEQMPPPEGDAYGKASYMDRGL
ncbi:hypothetical protein DENSPDRAFT_673021 [Dentipellis sp. KUC8613]|nr:hypothetical protein DENSPDRAFT_673021 [Dentipellis sp. KUC8613]